MAPNTYTLLTPKADFDDPPGDSARQVSSLDSREGQPLSRCRAAMQRLVVVPEESQWLVFWDLWIVTVLFITTYYEPYAVAVITHDTWWCQLINHGLDITFTIDMCLTFFIAYGVSTESSAESSLWVKDPVRIAKRYLNWPLSEGFRAGWFWIDLLTVLPGWLDVLLPHGATPRYKKGLVLLRLLRLVRLSKLVRLQHLLLRWHQQYGFPFYVVELGKFFFITTITVHWIACVWIVIEGKITEGKISFKIAPDKESWLSALINAKGDSCSPSAKEDPNCVYLISLYWATMTLTTVGYGDITAQNPVEYSVCTLAMLVVAYVWAYVVGKMVTLLESLDPEWQHFKQTMDTLQTLMASRGLPRELQVRLRRYMHESRATAATRVQRQHLEEHVTQSLQREVAQCSGCVMEQFTRGVFWARDLQTDALLDLVRALEPCSFGPGETMMMPQTLIFIRRGIAAVKGRVLNRGDIWGQSDILLMTEHLLESSYPRTLSYVDVLLLRRSQLIDVCSAFPHADKRIRRAQIRTATFRAFIKNAKQRAGHRHMSEGGRSAVGTATSFVNPGQSKGHQIVHSDETKLSDVQRLIKALVDKHDTLERNLGIVLANQEACQPKR